MTLLRKTKAVTNMSPSEIIGRYRFKRAGEYLHQGVSVTEVAYKIGFDNLSYFSNSFRELYGMTPSDFIKIRKHSSPDGIQAQV